MKFLIFFQLYFISRLKSITHMLFLILALTFFSSVSFSINAVNTHDSSVSAPKYRSEIQLLSAHHDYFRQNNALNFWRLIPYYVAQQTDSSCSVATVVMVVNASRVSLRPAVNDELATHNGILKRVNDPTWTQQVSEQGEGISLAELKAIMAKSLKAYGIKNFTIEMIHTENTSLQAKQKLHHYLSQSSKVNSFMVVNFDQGVIVNDASVGHFAPVGAYDAIKKRILILDPDRQWYEPYWVPEDLLLKAMATKDSSGKSYRGYLWITVHDKI